MARTVMSFTKRLRPFGLAGALALAGAGLSGCIFPQEPLNHDFGRALHENLVAQIADPDVVYGPNPPANGEAVGLAMQRYRTGTVIKPKAAVATDIGIFGSSNGPQ
jgi:hypothetical protein